MKKKVVRITRPASKWDTPTRLNDKLSIFVFLAAGYISLNLINTGVMNLLGVIFFASSLWGVVCLGKDLPFVFS